MRRLTLVLLAAISCVPLLSSAASAKCIVERFDKVLRDSYAAWLVTVTDAALSPDQEPRYWRLTVHVEQAPKGPPDGASAMVFASSCGPFMTHRMKRRAAAFIVGEQRFYMGDIRDDGSMVAYSEVLAPQGLIPEEQYQRALDHLGLTRGEIVSPLAPFIVGETPWWIPAALIVLAVGAAVLFLLRRRRSKST
jgi:hypothetical protein